MAHASNVFTILALFCASVSAADCGSSSTCDETSLIQLQKTLSRRTEPQWFAEETIEESEVDDGSGEDVTVGSGKGPAFDAFEANKVKFMPTMVAEESQAEAFADTVHDEREAIMKRAQDKIAENRKSLQANAEQNKQRVDEAFENRDETVQQAIAKVNDAKHEYADTKAHEAFVKNAAIAGLRNGLNAGIAAVGAMKRQDDREDRDREIQEARAAAAEAHDARIQGNMDAVNAATARKSEAEDYATQKSADITSGIIDASDDKTDHAEEYINRVDPFVTARGDSAASDFDDGTAQAQDTIDSAAAGDWPH